MGEIRTRQILPLWVCNQVRRIWLLKIVNNITVTILCILRLSDSSVLTGLERTSGKKMSVEQSLKRNEQIHGSKKYKMPYCICPCLKSSLKQWLKYSILKMANSFSECFKFSSVSPTRTDCLHSLLSSFLAANNENPAQTRLNNTGNLLSHISEKSRVGFVSEVWCND